MFLLRLGKVLKWAGPADDREAVRLAASDLMLRDGEEGLSVFAVDRMGDSREMAARHAVTNQRSANPIDFVAFEEALVLALGLEVVATTDDRIDPTLSERHREIRGLTPEMAERLAAAILASPGRVVERVTRGELDQLGSDLCRVDPELRRRLTPAWEARIAPLQG